MIYALIAASVMTLSQTAQAKHLPPACTAARPIVGRLKVARAPVRLLRGGAAYVLDAAGDLHLCAHDTVTLVGGDATILINRVLTPMRKGVDYSLVPYSRFPGPIRFVADLIYSSWNPFVTQAKDATAATQGDEEVIAFRVSGLDNGAARIGAGQRTLVVTFTGLPDARGVLIGPRGRTVVGTLVRTTPEQAPRIAFPNVRFVSGEHWIIRLSVGSTTITGTFDVTEGPLILPEIANDPEGQEGLTLRAMALAGSDPDRWSLEALQHVLEPGARRLKADDAETMLAAWQIAPQTRPHLAE